MVVAAGELVCPERLLVVHPLAAVVAVAAASGRSVKASEVQPLAA